MAVAVGEIQLTVTQKIGPLENGRSIYFGTATGGTEYPTGGASLGEEPTNSRYKLPAVLDYLKVEALGVSTAFVAPNKLKLFGGAATEVAAVELKSKVTMATAVAGVPFFAIGIN
jgi:hypothetical protein